MKHSPSVSVLSRRRQAGKVGGSGSQSAESVGARADKRAGRRGGWRRSGVKPRDVGESWCEW